MCGSGDRVLKVDKRVWVFGAGHVEFVFLESRRDLGMGMFYHSSVMQSTAAYRRAV